MKIISVLVVNKTASISTIIEGFFSQFLARLSYKETGIVFLIATFLSFEALIPTKLFTFSTAPLSTFFYPPLTTQTQSLFSEKITFRTEIVNFSKKTVVDESLPEGEVKIITKGRQGKKVFQTKVIYHKNNEFSRETILTEDIKPIDEVVAVSLSASEKFVETPEGKFKYSQKLNVWATSYDSTCRGCNETTAIGLKTGYGVIAVDPKIIPLRSKVYIPGYGIAVAGDTGGNIKGNKIDLGFDDLKAGNWNAKYTDIYILSE